MKICSKCGAQNAPTANFCTNCGCGEFVDPAAQQPPRQDQNAAPYAQTPPQQAPYAPPAEPQPPQQGQFAYNQAPGQQFAQPQQPPQQYSQPQQPQYAPYAQPQPPVKKKSSAGWIIAILAVLVIAAGAVLAIVLLNNPDDNDTSSSKSDKTEESDSGTSSKLDKSTLVGDWRLVADLSGLDDDAMWELLGSNIDVSQVKSLISAKDLSGVMNELLSAYRFSFSEDGEAKALLEISLCRSSMKKLYEKMFDNYGKMSLKDVADLSGTTEDLLKEGLDQMGKTWAQYCDEMKDAYTAQLNSMTDEQIAEQFNAENASGGFAECGKEGEYTISGSKLTLESESGGKTVFSYKNGQLVLDSFSGKDGAEENLTKIFGKLKNIKLKKVS